MIPKGYLYVICCACSFGFIPTLAKLTYNEGASLELVAFFRIIAGSFLMGIWSGWSYRKKLISVIDQTLQAINRPIALLVVVIGIFIAGMSLGYLSSYKYIPVSLSVLLFFTFPFWVLLINFIIDGVAVKPLKLLAFILAFSGLALCLGPNWNVLDPRGIALVLFGSLCSAGMIVGASKATQVISMPDLIFLSNTIGAIIVGLILFFSDSFSMSHTIGGWSGIASICILFVLGQLSLFAAIKFIGSAQTSLMLNIEPLVTIATAFLLLGERLILSQSIGVAVILMALFMTSSESSKFSLFINNNKSD